MSNDRRTIPVNAQGAVVTFTLKIEGHAIPDNVQVLRLTVYKELNKLATAKIAILDGDAAREDFPLSNEDLFVPGKTIEIFAGHQSEEDLIFKGSIVRHGIQIRQNGSSFLLLECKDTAYRMTLDRKSRYFQDVTDRQAIEEILGEYGIENELIDMPVTHPELVQYYTSDWDFVVSRAEVNAGFCTLEDGVFKVIKPDFEQEAVLSLQFGATMLEFDAEIDSRLQYKTVRSRAWNAADQELLAVEAQAPAIQEPGNISAESLAEAHGIEEYLLQHSGSLAESELQQWANAKLQKSRLAKVRGRVKFEGFAGVKAGSIVMLNGVGDRFNGPVFVSGIRHYLAEGEWETDLQFGADPRWFADEYPINAPPNAGIAPAIPGLQIGVVRQIHDDPDGAFRVLVNVPVINAEEAGTWCRMTAPDAGNQRGFFFRPDVGDEVVLGFVNNNPGDGIILGVLHSAAKVSPIEPAEENAEKGYVSGSGMKLLFNDEDVFVRLETPQGNQLVLSEAEGGILIEDQNRNKIMMDSKGISLESAADLILKATGDIKIEGQNVEHKAKAAFKADGSAGAELTTSAVAKIRGSLVQIN